MKLLITAGNTQAPIDKVRCLTNIFSGRTGGRIALAAHARGHSVCLLTSHAEALAFPSDSATWRLENYTTFQDLETLLAREVLQGNYDVIVHAAAVSDYLLAGVYVPAPGTEFVPATATWSASSGSPGLSGASAGKVKSKHAELWLRLTPAPKLVDRIREPWGFHGTLVKFKLEVGLSDSELLVVAEDSRRESAADWMVANTLEGMNDWAYLGPVNGRYEKVKRTNLSNRLLDLIRA